MRAHSRTLHAKNALKLLKYRVEMRPSPCSDVLILCREATFPFPFSRSTSCGSGSPSCRRWRTGTGKIGRCPRRSIGRYARAHSFVRSPPFVLPVSIIAFRFSRFFVFVFLYFFLVLVFFSFFPPFSPQRGWWAHPYRSRFL